MKRITKIAALAVLVMGVAAMLQPANAICGSPRLFSSGYSYVITPGCEDNSCANASMTDAATGRFWAIGDGDEALTLGIDNGSFPLVNGWGYFYPGYAAAITSSWAADAGIDGCVDFATDPQRCMAILVMDNNADTGEGAFALLTKEPDNIGNYDFAQAGNIDLISLPTPSIVSSVRTGGGTGVDVTVAGVSQADLDAGLYLDANCPAPAAGGTNAPIQGYQMFVQEVPHDAPAPSSTNVDDWTPVGDVTALGSPATVSSSCGGDPSVDKYLTTGIIFDSNFRNVWLSGNATRIECGVNLAEPDEVERKPRSRELRPGRSRGR